MGSILRLVIALCCFLTVIAGLFVRVLAYPPETYWKVEPFRESGDTIWVNVMLYPQYCWDVNCPPLEYSRLVVTPCPFDVPCSNGSFVLERQVNIYSTVTQLKLSIREKYQFSGEFSHQVIVDAMGIPCAREECLESGSVIVKTFPDDFRSAEAGYIGLFAGDTASTSCVTADDILPFPFEMWVWCRSSVRGLDFAEFKIAYPNNAIPGATTQNDEIIQFSRGSPEEGIGMIYGACQYDWHWILHQTIYITNNNASTLTIVPHPNVGSIEFSNCTGSDDSVWIWTNLYLNSCVPTATERSGWGSIKSLFGK